MYIETFDSQKIDKAKQRWSELNDSDLRSIGNDSERLVDVVSRKRGMDREQASREVDEFLTSCGCGESGSCRSNDPSASRADKQSASKRSSASQSGNKPATSNDDQTGEMAAAQAGRKTRPDTKKM